MSVYVDDMKARHRNMIMCHMIADSEHELLTIAEIIGIPQKWIQRQGTVHAHFDISLSKRILAIHYGAIEVTRRCLVKIIIEKNWAVQNTEEEL